MQGFSVTDLCAWYGEKQVLSNINMQIPGQGVTAIIGPQAAVSRRLFGASIGCTSWSRVHAWRGRSAWVNNVSTATRRIPCCCVGRSAWFSETEPIPDDVDRQNVLAGLTLTGRLDRGRSGAHRRRGARWRRVVG